MDKVDNLFNQVIESPKSAGLGEVVFDAEDDPKVQSILREKAILEYALRAELEGKDITESDLEKIESKVMLFDTRACLELAQKEASEIARSVLATTIVSDMLQEQLKLGIDPQGKKRDNNIVDSVTRRIMDAYPDLISAAESAGQHILEKYLEEGAKNVQGS